jgi:hypothetical protein
MGTLEVMICHCGGESQSRQRHVMGHPVWPTHADRFLDGKLHLPSQSRDNVGVGAGA